jgi:C-terminal processing protease CtpA/Prc
MHLSQTTAIILSVEQGSAAEGLGVHEGDCLVAVNGVDTSRMGPDKAARTLIRSDWPRVLAFAVAEVRVHSTAAFA